MGGGGGAKRPPTSFSPVASTNVGTSRQDFMTFRFNPFATLVQISRPYLKLQTLNQDHPSKNWFFWSNPYKIEVLITPLIETLELPNFGHMTTYTR